MPASMFRSDEEKLQIGIDAEGWYSEYSELQPLNCHRAPAITIVDQP